MGQASSLLAVSEPHRFCTEPKGSEAAFPEVQGWIFRPDLHASDSCYVYEHHSKSGGKISGKELGFCLFFGRVLHFYYNHCEQMDEDGCGLMGTPKEGLMAPLIFFCITSSVDHFSQFSHLPRFQCGILRLPPTIQKHENRGASAPKIIENLFVLDHGLAWWPSVFPTRVMMCRRTTHLWESISDLPHHSHFFSPLRDLITKYLVADWR